MFSSGRFAISCVHVICKRYAGHSKWQNIRHVKAAKDLEKSLLFTKLGQRIKVAIQESGSSNPANNLKLSQAIETAKNKHMPVNTIQSYINQAKKSSENSKTLWYELKGPRGSFFIIQTFTDNPKRTRDLIISATRKHSMTIENNLRNQFTHRGIIIAVPKSDMCTTDEYFVEHAIESGAEDVEQIPEDNKLQFLCHPDQVKNVADKLQKLGYEIEDADDHYIPLNFVNIDDDIIIYNLSKALEKLNNMPEVVKIYDNIQ